jgi:septal ring factor EnvC (AmiA/AmiB activator)
MDDCRHAWGPYVQAGVVDFVQQASDKYRFDLIGDLGPGLATSNLGIVYPHSRAAEVRKTLDQVRELFSQRLDPLRLLRREEELISTINSTTDDLRQLRKTISRLEARASHLQERKSELEKRNADLTTQISRLKERTDQLSTHYLSRRYVIADAAADKLLRIPGLKSLTRRNTA